MSGPYLENAVLIGQGVGRFKTIARGAAGTVLTQVTAAAEPVFGALNAATMLGTSKVPAANGGTAIDSSGSTGIAHVAAGTWSVAAVNLASADVTGTLPAAKGGTGQTVGAVAILTCWGLGVLLGVTTFLGPGADVTEVNVQFPVPVTGTVLGIYAAVSTAPGGTETFTYRLRLNAANAVGTFVITGAAVAGNVTGLTTAVAAGDLLCVRLVTSAAAATANHKISLAIRVDG